MAQGDKLHSILHPQSLEVQHARLKRQVARLTEVLAIGGNGASVNPGQHQRGTADGDGRIGQPSRIPVVAAEDIAVVTVADFSTDGTYRPTVQVTIPTEYERTRGFAGYAYRFTNQATGEKLLCESGVTETLEGFITFPMYTRLLAAPNYGDGEETWTVEVMVRSGFGDGAWSAPAFFATSSDEDGPPPSPSVTLTPQVQALRVAWGLSPDATDYASTTVYGGIGDFSIGSATALTASKGSNALIPWDKLGTFTDIKVRHRDYSGNWGDLSPNATITPTMLTAMAIQGPHLSSTLDYDGIFTIQGSGFIQNATGEVQLGTSGLLLQSPASTGDFNLFFKDLDGAELGHLSALGRVADDTGFVELKTVSGNLNVESAGRLNLTSGSLGMFLTSPDVIEMNATSGMLIAAADLTIATLVKVLGSSTADLQQWWTTGGSAKQLWVDKDGAFHGQGVIVFQNDGDEYGGSRVSVVNRTNFNGVHFELLPTDTGIGLFDMIVSHPLGTRQIRLEGRAGPTMMGTAQEWQLGSAAGADWHTVMSAAGLYQRQGYVRGAYHSSDNSVGITTDVIVGTVTLSFKDGILVTVTDK